MAPTTSRDGSPSVTSTMDAARRERSGKKSTFTRRVTQANKALDKRPVDLGDIQKALRDVAMAHEALTAAHEKVCSLLPPHLGDEDSKKLHKPEEDYIEAVDDEFNSITRTLEGQVKLLKAPTRTPKKVSLVNICTVRLQSRLKTADNILKEANPASSDLEEVRENLKKAHSAFEDAFSEYMVTLEENSQDHNEATRSMRQIDADFQDRMRATGKMLRDKTNASSAVRFQPVKIAEFDGQYVKFRQWWDQFTATVHRNEQLPVNTKLTMLLNSLRGEAKKAVEHFRFEDSSYEPVRQALQARFGQDAIILQEVVMAMINLQPKGSGAAECRETLDTMTGHLQTLRAVGAQVDEGPSAGTFIAIILPKLRHEHRKVWYKYVHDRQQDRKDKGFPPLAEFLTVIGREIDADRKASTGATKPDRRDERPHKPTALVTQQREGSGAKRKEGSGLKKVSQSPQKAPDRQGSARPAMPASCGICGLLAGAANGHDAVACPEGKQMTPKGRFERVQAAKACFACMNKGHMKPACPKKAEQCGVDGCRGYHHPLIHLPKQQ